MKQRAAVLVVVFSAVAAFLAASSACRKGAQADDYQWTTNDSEQKGLFPVEIRNYGKDVSILRRFRGTNFAKPNEAALNMAFPGLEDWMLIDIKYKNEKDKEVLRTVLYVQVEGAWRVGDSGGLLK
jgi:hypothetical protein